RDDGAGAQRIRQFRNYRKTWSARIFDGDVEVPIVLLWHICDAADDFEDLVLFCEGTRIGEAAAVSREPVEILNRDRGHGAEIHLFCIGIRERFDEPAFRPAGQTRWR